MRSRVAVSRCFSAVWAENRHFPLHFSRATAVARALLLSVHRRKPIGVSFTRARDPRRATSVTSHLPLNHPARSSAMQMIEAVIKPHKLDAVKTALAKLGILGVTAV